MTAEEVMERWDDLGKDLEMGSSDEMSDDDQCSGLKNLMIWMIQMSQSWSAAMTSLATWGK